MFVVVFCFCFFAVSHFEHGPSVFHKTYLSNVLLLNFILSLHNSMLLKYICQFVAKSIVSNDSWLKLLVLNLTCKGLV